MGSLISVWRSLRVAEHVATGTVIALFVVCGRHLGLETSWVPGAVRWWHARLCRALGLRLEIIGTPITNALLVANHVSWLDIPVIGAQGRIGFLSKAEVRDWPLIGWLAQTAGTHFISRGGNRTGELTRCIVEHLRNGGCTVIFPEGTTTDGTRLQHFHPRMFAAGADEGVQVQPVAVRYGTNVEPDRVAPFIGDDALIPHLLGLVRHPGLRVRIHFLPPLTGVGLERDTMSRACRNAIAVRLGLDFSDAPRRRGHRDRTCVPPAPGTSLGEAA